VHDILRVLVWPSSKVTIFGDDFGEFRIHSSSPLSGRFSGRFSGLNAQVIFPQMDRDKIDRFSFFVQAGLIQTQPSPAQSSGQKISM